MKYSLFILLLFVFGCGSDDDVVPPMLTSISISSSQGNLVVVGFSIQLNVSGVDQNNDPISVESDILWSANNENVVVDQNGTIEGILQGESIITATTQEINATFNITIEEQLLTTIEISSSNGNRLDLEETTTLTASGKDQQNNFMNIDVVWESSNSNVIVDANGLVTGKIVGNSVITASTEGVESTFNISVWDSSAPRTEIYVSDVGVNRNGPHQILKYDENGDDGEVFINSSLNRPQDIVFLEDQQIVLVSNLGSNNINKYDINSGSFVGTFASGLNGPTRVEIGPDDLIYVIQWNGGPVKRYEQDGTFVDDFTSLSINQAIGIAWDTSGNLYVSSFNDGSNGNVRKFDSSGESQGLFINSNLSGPTDIWFDGAGNMLVNDWSANRVRKFNSSGTFLEDFITGLSQPEGVDFLDGNILIGNSGNGSVKMYNGNGDFIEDIVSSGAAGLTTTNAVKVRFVNQ